MMSNVSENGPAFLLRIRLVSCTSFIDGIPDGNEFCTEHLFLGMWQSYMMEVKAIHCSAIDMCGIMKKCECGDRAFPLRDRMVEQRLAGLMRDRNRVFLRRGCCFEDQTNLFWNGFAVGFQLSHDRVASVNVKCHVIFVFGKGLPKYFCD